MHESVDRIAIIGAGAIGTAVGDLLKLAGKTVALWDKDPAKSNGNSLAATIAQAQVIILAVPSWANQPAAAAIPPLLSAQDHPLVITLAKGVEPGFVTMDKVLARAAKQKFDCGLLYGPMLAEEIAGGKQSYGLLAVSDLKWRGCLDGVKGLCLAYTHDVSSVAVAGTLKNIYALGFGICDGLNLGSNTKGALALKSVREMRGVLTVMDLDPGLAESYAGLADLLATGWSETSFNYRIGKALAEGLTSNEHTQGEGVNAVKEITSVLEISRFPVMDAIYQVATHQQKPDFFTAVIDD